MRKLLQHHSARRMALASQALPVKLPPAQRDRCLPIGAAFRTQQPPPKQLATWRKNRHLVEQPLHFSPPWERCCQAVYPQVLWPLAQAAPVPGNLLQLLTPEHLEARP